MRVRVRLFANLRDRLPHAERGRGHLDLPGESSLQDLIALLEIPSSQAQMVLVNGDQAPRSEEQRASQLLEEDDVVSIFPPLAGG
jgi:molybdopterin converting factor small subunit